MWSQKLLAGKTASGIAICMFSFHPSDPQGPARLLAVGSRWKHRGLLRRCLHLVHLPFRAQVGQISSHYWPFSRRLCRTDLRMSFLLWNVLLSLMKTHLHSLLCQPSHLPSSSSPLTPPPHTLQAELGAALSVVPNILYKWHSVAVPVLRTGAFSQRDLAPGLCDSGLLVKTGLYRRGHKW